MCDGNKIVVSGYELGCDMTGDMTGLFTMLSKWEVEIGVIIAKCCLVLNIEYGSHQDQAT